MPGPLSEQTAKSLASELAEDRLVLFAGAGLSRLARHKTDRTRRLPLWGELIEQIRQEYGTEEMPKNPLDLLDDVVFNKSRGDLESWVRKHADDREYELSAAHQAIARMPWHAVITTNYDRLLRSALKSEPISEDKHYDRVGKKPEPHLFHVHGTLSDPHTLTRTDYHNWREKHPRAWGHMEQLVQSRTLLFIGYGYNDLDLADGLMPRVRQMMGGRDRRHYALMWQATEADTRRLDKRDKIEVISINKEAEISAALKQIEAAWKLAREKGPSASAGPAGGGPRRAQDRFAAERQAYVRWLGAQYRMANLQGLYVAGSGYSRDDITIEEIFVEPDVTVPKRSHAPADLASGIDERLPGSSATGDVQRRSSAPASRPALRELVRIRGRMTAPRRCDSREWLRWRRKEGC
jgi:hypothetical protein